MPHQITVTANQTLLSLPNGQVVTTTATPLIVIMTDDEYDQISPHLFTSGALTDQGATAT